MSLEAKDIGAITKEDATAIIVDNVALEVASIKPELKTEIMLDVDNRMSAFKEDVTEQLRLNTQQVISIVEQRIAARLADVDQIVEAKVDAKLDDAWIDAGVVTEG